MGYDDQAQHQNRDRWKAPALIALLDYESYVFKIENLISILEVTK
jgi:hypothetical protein